MKYLALHGIPITTDTWRLLSTPLQCYSFVGLATQAQRTDWSLESFVAEVLPNIDEKTIIIGHDFGGVIAAMCAIQKKPAAVVLTGTALGRWWTLTRLSAHPVCRYFFYDLFGGTLFIRFGHNSKNTPTYSRDTIADWPQRMRTLAQQMKPPPGLAQRIPCPLYLIWGKKDRWYPPLLAKKIARTAQAKIYWIDGGHYAMRDNPIAFDQALEKIQEDLINQYI